MCRQVINFLHTSTYYNNDIWFFLRTSHPSKSCAFPKSTTYHRNGFGFFPHAPCTLPITLVYSQCHRNCPLYTSTYGFHSFIPLARAECNDSLLFSGASSIPLCYVLFPATLLHQLFFHPLSPHLAIYFLVNLSILLFPNSYIILFLEFYFLPFSVHAQTNVIYLTLLSLLQ
jgi:hypothetical protein